VLRLRAQGFSYAKISAALNAAGVPTPGGGSRWMRSYVDRVLHTRYAMEIQAERQTISTGLSDVSEQVRGLDHQAMR
jgi:hypothetical protein